ncbi:MAG: hypothetical protein IT229_04730, partial [Flavobacteriales bacterium]|nr:hypothetical protein [Flavobacteriales bacterium]
MRSYSVLQRFFLGTALVCAAALRWTPASAQCTNNNTLTGSAVTPPCPGTTSVACVLGGEYALVNVVNGNTYTFQTCGGAAWDTQITLFNGAAATSLAY